MAKVDKELLIKHSFWIVLGSFLLLWGIGMIVLLASAGGAVDEKKSAYDKVKDSVSGLASKGNIENGKMATPAFTEAYAKKEQKLKLQKDKVWISAWNDQDEKLDPTTQAVIQEPLFAWPTELAIHTDSRSSTKVKTKYFGEVFDGDLQEADRQRSHYKDTLYPKQLDDFRNGPLPPFYSTPIGPAYYNGSWDRVIMPVVWNKQTTPSNEECWLAQEDFCVKRELIRVLRETIDSVGRCSQVKLDPAKDPPAPGTTLQRVKNTSWELDLVLEKDKKGLVQISPKSTLKNIHPDGRTLARSGVLFRIQQRDASGVPRNPVPLYVEGEPMARFEEEKKGPVQPLLRKDALPLAGFDDQLPLEVDQIFNWYNSPIKRLDRLEVGNVAAQSHRTATRPLVTARQFPQTQPETPAPGGGGEFGGGPPGGGGAPPFPMGGGPDGPGFGGGQQAPRTQAQALRYVDLSDQVRRMPVGMVLVVDQAYIPDLLTTMANSRLRMWTTQLHWKHVPGGQVPAPPEESSGSGKPPMDGGFGGTGAGSGDSEGPMPPTTGSGPKPGSYGPPRPGAGGFGGPPSGMMPPGSMFPGGGVGGDPSAALALLQDDPNLVEIAIYSIASLYERYPPKPASDSTTTPSP